MMNSVAEGTRSLDRKISLARHWRSLLALSFLYFGGPRFVEEVYKILSPSNVKAWDLQTNAPLLGDKNVQNIIGKGRASPADDQEEDRYQKRTTGTRGALEKAVPVRNDGLIIERQKKFYDGGELESVLDSFNLVKSLYPQSRIRLADVFAIGDTERLAGDSLYGASGEVGIFQIMPETAWTSAKVLLSRAEGNVEMISRLKAVFGAVPQKADKPETVKQKHDRFIANFKTNTKGRNTAAIGELFRCESYARELVAKNGITGLGEGEIFSLTAFCYNKGSGFLEELGKGYLAIKPEKRLMGYLGFERVVDGWAAEKKTIAGNAILASKPDLRVRPELAGYVLVDWMKYYPRRFVLYRSINALLFDKILGGYSPNLAKDFPKVVRGMIDEWIATDLGKNENTSLTKQRQTAVELLTDTWVK